jgi:hypothetical protein
VFLDEAARALRELHAIVDKSEYLETLMHEAENASLDWLRERVQKMCSAYGWLTIFEIPEMTESQSEMEALLK